MDGWIDAVRTTRKVVAENSSTSGKLPYAPLKKRSRWRKILAFIPWAVRGGYKVAKKLPKEKRHEIIAVAKDPDAWGEAIAKGWDVAKVEAIEAKDAFATLGKIALGRKTNRPERKQAAAQLGMVGLVVVPLGRHSNATEGFAKLLIIHAETVVTHREPRLKLSG